MIGHVVSIVPFAPLVYLDQIDILFVARQDTGVMVIPALIEIQSESRNIVRACALVAPSIHSIYMRL